uniref:Uncharacterized protein n=1 Tax=Siphoviridae sp. ct2kB26 TaxID=2825317 RepID=A0A8S5P7Y1_9CAUD|nr:MAG TPA: hypothetical protein [Siphoviridae sp. ct2kB26]
MGNGGGAVVLSNQDGCCGGIAAEIGAKDMPPACFLNAPTCDNPLRHGLRRDTSPYTGEAWGKAVPELGTGI